jgi:hypothetical protein
MEDVKKTDDSAVNWRAEFCERCAVGMPMSGNPRFHFTGWPNPPKCTAPTAEEYIALLRAQTQWQPIETAPKDGTPVLCYARIAHGGVSIVMRWDGEDWYESLAFSCLLRPTHWMPLPKPPEVSHG